MLIPMTQQFHSEKHSRDSPKLIDKDVYVSFVGDSWKLETIQVSIVRKYCDTRKRESIHHRSLEAIKYNTKS